MIIDYIYLLVTTLIFISIVIIHELGHYIAFRLYGYKPSLKLRLAGLFIGENVIMRITRLNTAIIALAGVMAGLIPIMLLNLNREWYLIYMIMCSQDLVIILDVNKKNYKKTNLQILKDYVAKYETN